MIFGVFSDLHGSVGKWNAVNALAQQVDLLLSAGDITPVMKAKTPPILSIYGNHDDYENLKENCILLEDGLTYRCAEIYAINGNFAKTRRHPWHKTPAMIQELFKQHCAEIDIAVTHEPPHGVAWRKGRYASTCSEMVTDFFAEHKPKVWFYGHSYVDEAIQEIRGIKTVNVNRRFATYDVDAGELKVLELPYDTLIRKVVE